MNELRLINSGELWKLFPQAPSRLIEFAANAAPMYAWFVSDTPVAVLGLTPVPDMPEFGYIWGWNTELVRQHPIAYALNVQRLVKAQLNRYSVLLGHCTASKCAWVESFGGQIYDRTGDDMFNFKIEAVHV